MLTIIKLVVTLFKAQKRYTKCRTKSIKKQKKMVKQCYHQDVLHVAVKLIFMWKNKKQKNIKMVRF